MSGNRKDTETINLEAPGEVLSELLGVYDASLFLPESETIQTVSVGSGLWCVLSPGNGSCHVAWEDRAWDLSEPQAVAFPGSTELTLLMEKGCMVRLLTLGGDAASTVFSACRDHGGLFFEGGGLAMEHLFSILSSRNGSAVRAKEASEAAYGLLMAFYGTQSAGPAERQRLPLAVEAALGIIRKDYAFLDGIGELADRLEVSQEYLTRSFCHYIGITPGKYLNRIRIENACQLLRQGGHSIQFVSEACGFTNANYFARVFRNSMGVNPAEYARQHLPDQNRLQDERIYVL